MTSSLIELEFGGAGFCGGRKTGEPGENPWSKVRTSNKLIAPKSNPGNIGERRAHSPLHHPCFLQEVLPMLNTQVSKVYFSFMSRVLSIVHVNDLCIPVFQSSTVFLKLTEVST